MGLGQDNRFLQKKLESQVSMRGGQGGTRTMTSMRSHGSADSPRSKLELNRMLQASFKQRPGRQRMKLAQQKFEYIEGRIENGASRIVFLDLDNTGKIFNKFKRVSARCKGIIFIGFSNKNTKHTFQNELDDIILFDNLVGVKNSADIALAFVMGRLDFYTPIGVKFTMVSNDKGFQVLEQAPHLQKISQNGTRMIDLVDQKVFAHPDHPVSCNCEGCEYAAT